MWEYSLNAASSQLDFFKSIREDYLYNFSMALNKPLIGPFMLQMMLTTKCNLRCKMCGVWRADEKELDTFYVKKVIDDAYTMGNLREVYFTGGEAFLRPDIYRLIKYVKDYYRDVRVTVNTNGMILTKKNIDKIIDLGLDTLGISIDSPDPKIHNALRGEHVLESVVEAVNYINAEKKRRNKIYPRLNTCCIIMEQTLDTISGMVDFCIQYGFSGMQIQPYVCNSDLRGKREDGFWIKGERLVALKDILQKIESRKGTTCVYIEVPSEKIYRYFSEPVYIDKCYAGFTRALVVGKKINFVCNGPNNEIEQHFGMADKDSVNLVWFSDKANFFRNTIKACRRNCAQFCSIRPTSDSVNEIHQRLLEQHSLFLVFRELNLLKEYMREYPGLPLNDLIDSNLRLLTENLAVLEQAKGQLSLDTYSDAGIRKHLASDLDWITKR